MKEQGLPEAEARLAAIRRISFGKHRIAFGYDDFEVILDPYKQKGVDLGPSYGFQRVPDQIEVIARPLDLSRGR